MISVSLDGPAARALQCINTVLRFLGDANPRLCIRWLVAARPCVVLEARMQKVYSVVDAFTFTDRNKFYGVGGNFEPGAYIKRILEITRMTDGDNDARPWESKHTRAAKTKKRNRANQEETNGRGGKETSWLRADGQGTAAGRGEVGGEDGACEGDGTQVDGGGSEDCGAPGGSAVKEDGPAVH